MNNTGVFFEILGMVVFAFILAIFHNHQGVGRDLRHRREHRVPAPVSTFLVAMFMSLFVIYGFDTASTLAEETQEPAREAPKAVIASVIGAFVIGAIFLWAHADGDPRHGRGDRRGLADRQQIIDANFVDAVRDRLPARRRRPPSSSAACRS